MEVILQAGAQLTDFTLEPTDLGIRVGNGQYPGLASELLMDDYYYPVVSPRYNGDGAAAIARGAGAMHLVPLPVRALAAMVSGGAAGSAGTDQPAGVPGCVDAGARRDRREWDALARMCWCAGTGVQERWCGCFDVALKCPFFLLSGCLPGSLLKPQVQVFREWLLEEIGGALAMKFGAAD